MDVRGAGVALNESTVDDISFSEPFFQRRAEELPMSITAWEEPVGIVATIRAFLGISVWVDCERVEKLTSRTL